MCHLAKQFSVLSSRWNYLYKKCVSIKDESSLVKFSVKWDKKLFLIIVISFMLFSKPQEGNSGLPLLFVSVVTYCRGIKSMKTMGYIYDIQNAKQGLIMFRKNYFCLHFLVLVTSAFYFSRENISKWLHSLVLRFCYRKFRLNVSILLSPSSILYFLLVFPDNMWCTSP